MNIIFNVKISSKNIKNKNYSKKLGLGPWISGRRRDEDSGFDFLKKEINEKL